MKKEKNFPKYYLIASEIINQIRSGKVHPGMQILSENEIITKYNVSNTTARKALHEIELSGWGKRIKGKGTFARKKDVERSINRILSFTKNMHQAGLRPSARLLAAEELKEGYSAVINGRKYTLPGPVYRIHRLRFADNIPMLLEVRYISPHLCPGIIQKDLKGSLYDVYESTYQLELKEIQQQLSVVILNEDEKAYFNLDENVPALLIDGVTFCGNEIILEMERSIYRGDKYHFSITAVK